MNKKLLIFIKLICIIHLIIFLPKIISYCNIKTKIIFQEKSNTPSGMEALLNINNKKFNWIKKLKLTLVSNNIYEKNKDDKQNINLLLEQGFKIKKIFEPINDYTNSDFLVKRTDHPSPADSAKVASATTAGRLRITSKSINFKNIIFPIFSWNSQKQILNKKDLFNTNAILFDITNSGLRFDLCFKTLIQILHTAEKHNTFLIVLDRPNPLGSCMEGPGVIPLRYGITIGELASYLNKNILQKPVNLTIIPMANWQRNKPNIEKVENSKNLNSLYCYSFLRLLNEIKPIQIEPTFETILLPEENELSKWEINYLKEISYKLGFFCKNYSKWDKNNKIWLRGVKIRIKKNINQFSSFNSLLTLARFLKNRKNIKLSYSNMFDNMIGSTDIKEFLQNKISFEQLKSNTENNLNAFYLKAKEHFLYKPFPKIKKVEIIRG